MRAICSISSKSATIKLDRTTGSVFYNLGLCRLLFGFDFWCWLGASVWSRAWFRFKLNWKWAFRTFRGHWVALLLTSLLNSLISRPPAGFKILNISRKNSGGPRYHFCCVVMCRTAFLMCDMFCSRLVWGLSLLYRAPSLFFWHQSRVLVTHVVYILIRARAYVQLWGRVRVTLITVITA